MVFHRLSSLLLRGFFQVSWHVDPGRDEAGFAPHRDRHLGEREAEGRAAVAPGFRGGTKGGRAGVGKADGAGDASDDDDDGDSRVRGVEGCVDDGGRGARADDPGFGPRYVTCWVALGEAAPDNGCLYVVPRRFERVCPAVRKCRSLTAAPLNLGRRSPKFTPASPATLPCTGCLMSAPTPGT